MCLSVGVSLEKDFFGKEMYQVFHISYLADKPNSQTYNNLKCTPRRIIQNKLGLSCAKLSTAQASYHQLGALHQLGLLTQHIVAGAGSEGELTWPVGWIKYLMLATQQLELVSHQLGLHTQPRVTGTESMAKLHIRIYRHRPAIEP